jgi:hypothetical protein
MPREMRGNQDSRVPREVHGAPGGLFHFPRPVLAPCHPRLMQRSEILAVVGDQGLPLLSGTEENLSITQAESTKFLGRVGILSVGTEEGGDTVRDILVEGEPEDGGTRYARAAAFASSSASIAPRCSW